MVNITLNLIYKSVTPDDLKSPLFFFNKGDHFYCVLNYPIESSKFGPNQRFASSNVQPLRFA